MKRYEAMFLFDTTAARDWSGVEQEVRRLCDRIGAQLLACVKFDERKLAYEIRRRKRGTYALAYFDAAPERIGELERDARLSELILRLLVLRAENLTEERLAELRAHSPEVSLVPMSGDGRRHDDDRRWGDRHGGPPYARREAPADTEAGPAREAVEADFMESEPVPPA